jgi:proteasome lid subunit RPN8/RPN11
MTVFDDIAFGKMTELTEDAYPHEGCGVLLSDQENGEVKDVYTADNIEKKDKRQFHFITDPLEIYELECRAEKDGYKVVGFFHSHPDCEAVLSVEDEKYMIPKMLYLIVSVRDGIYRDVKGYIKAGPDERASYVGIKAR